MLDTLKPAAGDALEDGGFELVQLRSHLRLQRSHQTSNNNGGINCVVVNNTVFIACRQGEKSAHSS